MGSCRLSPGNAPPWSRNAVLLGLVALAALALASAAATGAPTLLVTSPPTTLTYQSSNSATLAGSVDPANASLSVNGGPDLADGSGSFSVVLPLSIGANNFSLRATDPAGASG